MTQMRKLNILFLVDGGIGNAIQALYAVEFCLREGVRVAIYLSKVNPSFQNYLRDCYGEEVVLNSVRGVETEHLIHSFTFQERIDLSFDSYFYIQPDYHSSRYLSETQQYLSVVRALYSSNGPVTVLKRLIGEFSDRVRSLNIEDKTVLCPGCSPASSAKRWPYYLALSERLGSDNVLFIGGDGDLDFESSYIYPKYMARVLPQKLLNSRELWRFFKKMRLLRPFSHYEEIKQSRNAYFDYFRWPELVEIFRRCKCCVTNDNGLMHLASAVGARGVAIFGPTSRDKNRPLNPNMIALSNDYSCQPCQFGVGKVKMAHHYINCPYQMRCLTNLTVDKVLGNLK